MCGGGESAKQQGSQQRGMARAQSPQPAQSLRGSQPKGATRPAPGVQPMKPVAKSGIGRAIEMGGR